MSKTTSAALVVVLALFTAAGASAQPADAEARSRQLFEQGRALTDQQRWSEACPVLQQAHDLNATNGTALQLANCYDKLGQPDKSYPLYERIVNAGDAKHPERVEYAKSRMAEIDRARAPAAVPSATPTAAPPPPKPAEPAPARPVARTPDARPSRAPAYVAFGVGAAGLGVGAIFGALALSQAGSVDDACPGGKCQSEAERQAEAEEQSGARTKGWISNIGLGVGVVGVVAGVVLLATAGPPSTVRASARGVEVRF